MLCGSHCSSSIDEVWLDRRDVGDLGWSEPTERASAQEQRLRKYPTSVLAPVA